MSSTTLLQFEHLSPGFATHSMLGYGKVSVHLKLDEHWSDFPLNALNELWHYFGVPLHLYSIEQGCIAVFLWCSTSYVKELKLAILENVDLLQTIGLLQAFIGEELIVECSQPDDPHMAESMLEYSKLESRKNCAKICLLQNTAMHCL